jgi:cyclophilin family peptidyl-prolyl cis-trans isomerase
LSLVDCSFFVGNGIEINFVVSIFGSLVIFGSGLKHLVWFFSFFFSSSLFAADNSVVTIETPLGTFQMELLADDAPNTVQNFLNYVERGAYDGTFFHRSVPGFIVQGGGFAFDPFTSSAPGIAVDEPVVNEFGESNIRGTVAMAKTAAGPDSATSQWFVNLANNSANLDNQNGGFTVFARVIGDGMQVVDEIAALPRTNLGGAFTDTPTINFTGTVSSSIFVTIDKASSNSEPDFDGDGIPDSTDADDDNDGVPDVSDAFSMNAAEFADTDNDGTGNNEDTDDDGDNVLDVDDAFPLDNLESVDTDGDGVGDNSDIPVKLMANTILELTVTGRGLSAPDGSALTVPSNATAVSLNVTVVKPSADGFITVWPCSVDKPNASNLNYVTGQVVANGVIAPVGSNGKVCFSALRETDLVVDIAGWFAGDVFVGVTPKRLIDTRIGTGTSTIARITPANPLRVKVTEIEVQTAAGVSTQIPSNSVAVALNVTAVNPSAGGHLTVYPCDVARPEASNLNYLTGKIVPNGVIAPVSASGEVCIFTLAETDIVVDLAGWFTGGFIGSTPKRLVDTRNGTGGQASVVRRGQILEIPIRGEILSVQGSAQTVPVGATAAALNITVVRPTGNGFVTVFPCGVTQPNASNLNYLTGDVVANNVTAPVGENGRVCLTSLVDSNVVVDISGWFEGDANNGFVGATPNRLVDTRIGVGPAPR